MPPRHGCMPQALPRDAQAWLSAVPARASHALPRWRLSMWQLRESAVHTCGFRKQQITFICSMAARPTMCGALGVALVLLQHVQLLNAEGANSLRLVRTASMLIPVMLIGAHRGPPQALSRLPRSACAALHLHLDSERGPHSDSKQAISALPPRLPAGWQ